MVEPHRHRSRHVDDVIAGAVTQVGDQAVNIARNALLGAGFPETVPGTTVDRQCGSSQQAINFAAQGVIAGAYDIVIAAGVESMSRVPMGSSVLPGSDPFGAHGAALPRRSGAAGHQRRTDRRQVGAFAHRTRRVLGGQPREGRARHQGGPVRQRARADRRADHRRDHPSRHHRRDARRAQARVLQRGVRGTLPADRLGHHPGQLLAAVRRQRGGADHQRRGGPPAGPAARWPASTPPLWWGPIRCTC